MEYDQIYLCNVTHNMGIVMGFFLLGSFMVKFCSFDIHKLIDAKKGFNRVTEGEFTHPYLPISLHSFGTGSLPLWRGGTLDSQPRPYTPAVKVDWFAVPSVRSRGRPLVSV